MTPCPKQPCYPWPHVHYPDWLRMGDAVEQCKCGRHPRRISVEAVLQSWKAGRT